MIRKLNEKGEELDVAYKGRVVDVISLQETRNCSPTLDYKDYKSVTSVYAIVWLGLSGENGKSLLPWEQFKRIDCTNLWFRDLYDWELVPEKTSFKEAENPIMWVNYIAYKNWVANEKQAAAEATKREQERLLKESKAKLEAKNKRIQDSLAKATKDLEIMPQKGTVIPGKGTVFYRDIKIQNNSLYVAICGIKTPSGVVKWLKAKDFNGGNK